MPDGNAITPSLISGVTHYPKKGVMCRDSNSNTIAYVKVTNNEHGVRVRDLLLNAADRDITVIDWSFLTDEQSV